MVTLILAFYVGDIADTVLVAINKIGSLINGPVLGVFSLGILTSRCNGVGARAGLLAGFGLNLLCWQFVPQLSWLWWNVFGFMATVLVGYGVSLAGHWPRRDLALLHWTPARYKQFGFWVNWLPRYCILAGWFVFLLIVLILF